MSTSMTFSFTLMVVVVVFHWSNNAVLARSTGAPREACINLKPKHGLTIPQPLNTCPYIIAVENRFNETDGKEYAIVNITSKEDSPMIAFRGFIMQARFANNPDIIVDGHFDPADPKRTQTYTCKLSAEFRHNVSLGSSYFMLSNDFREQNTWTHSNNEPKEMVSATWTPPEDFSEDIVFVGTIIKDKTTYWEQLTSKSLIVGSLINVEEEADEKENRSETMEKGKTMSAELLNISPMFAHNQSEMESSLFNNTSAGSMIQSHSIIIGFILIVAPTLI